jgi:hypothetical protein
MVQVFSRFILAYLLALFPDAASSVVKRGIMSIMSPGRTMQKTNYDDLELLNARKRGKHSLVAVFSRDSNVVDAFTEVRPIFLQRLESLKVSYPVWKEIAQRNTNITVTHVFPGIVKTNVLKNTPPPWYHSGYMRIGMALMGCPPESYAEVPFYLLANPEGCRASAKVRFWDQKIRQVKVDPSVQDKANRAKVWTHLCGVAGF